jgi:hypothetical protein
MLTPATKSTKTSNGISKSSRRMRRPLMADWMGSVSWLLMIVWAKA